MRAWYVLVVLALPALAGCTGPSGGFPLVANAPQLANGMNIAVAIPPGPLGAPTGTASFIIYYEGKAVYPGGDLGAPLPVEEGKGSAFVPYRNFVVGNGDYEVKVRFKNSESVTQVEVRKWVNWVYPFPYVKNNNLIIEVTLSRSFEPNDRVFAEGQLNLNLHYRGEDGRMNQVRLSRVHVTDGSQSFHRFTIPLRSLSSETGYYSVEATFHNFHANGNNWVKMNPTLQNNYPHPTNWVYIER